MAYTDCENELEKELQEEIYEMNLKNSQKGSVGQSLEALLSGYTMDKLKILASENEIPNRSKMRKGELVAALQKAVLDEESIVQQMMIMPEEEYQFLHDVAHGSTFADQAISPVFYGYAAQRGYVYVLDDHGVLYYDMPPEVKKLFIEHEDAETLKKAADLRLKWEYIEGMTNFFGITTFAEVAELYNQYNDADLSADDFGDVYRLFSQREQLITYYREHLVNGFLLEEGEFEELYLVQQKYPRYIPTEEQILAYVDEWMFEMSPATVTLKEYLRDAFGEEPDFPLEDLVSEIQAEATLESSFQEIFDLFENYEVKFTSFEQAKEIVRLLTDVINNTRLWSLNGYTPLEMHRINGMEIQTPPELEIPSREPIRVTKVGRNDPCPCGSGKKYKKCCGR